MSLYDELALAPKPGLVSFEDNGSHDDMDAGTFLRSLNALRPFFMRFAWLGWHGAEFAKLEAEGIAAEARMLEATGGINTHRGAIFTIGLLSAGAGRIASSGGQIAPRRIREALLSAWGADLHLRATSVRQSHGAEAARRYGLRSVSAEAAEGFPVLFDVVFPVLLASTHSGLPPSLARLDAIVAAMAVLDDTNLAHRGGISALRYVQQSAQGFMRCGGAAAPDALNRARAMHASLVSRRLSPGGAADMLAAACFLQSACRVSTFATE